MSMFDDAKDKAEDLLGKHGDKAAEGLDKASEFADEKTGGKYSDQLDRGADKAKDAMQDFAGGDDRQ